MRSMRYRLHHNLTSQNYRIQKSFLKDFWWKWKLVLKHLLLPKVTQVDIKQLLNNCALKKNIVHMSSYPKIN